MKHKEENSLKKKKITVDKKSKWVEKKRKAASMLVCIYVYFINKIQFKHSIRKNKLCKKALYLIIKKKLKEMQQLLSADRLSI